MVIKVEHPNGYAGVLYGNASMSIYDKEGHECLHTCFRRSNTEEELYAVLETMPKAMEIIAKEFDCQWK